MERKLPTVDICDTDFIVDIEKKEFRELENSSNIIPFGKVYIHSDDIVINYDKSTHNVYEGDWLSFVQDPNTQAVHLPPLIELDRFGVMGTLVTTELQDDGMLYSRHDKADYEKSVARELPKMEIGDTHFYVDVRLGEFRKVDDPLHRIPHSELFVLSANNVNTVGLIYDPQTKLAFSGTREQYEQRNDLRIVQIRNLSMMNADTSGIPFKTLSHPVKPEGDKGQPVLVKRKGRGI